MSYFRTGTTTAARSGSWGFSPPHGKPVPFRRRNLFLFTSTVIIAVMCSLLARLLNAPTSYGEKQEVEESFKDVIQPDPSSSQIDARNIEVERGNMQLPESRMIFGADAPSSGEEAPAVPQQQQRKGLKPWKKGRRRKRKRHHGYQQEIGGEREREGSKSSQQTSPHPKQFNPLDPKLPPSHRCANFTLPPPPSDPKRTGPRPCPVCYLPVAEALGLRPDRTRESARPMLKELTFVTEADDGEQRAKGRALPPRFAGYQSLEERAESFHIRENMHVHCGFVWGGQPGDGTGFDSSTEDQEYMHSCKDVVVASAIFGAYDLVQQPSGISDASQRDVCFVMFVDEATHTSLLQDGTLKDESQKHVGLWRIVLVKNLPYSDPRRTGKIPKLLAHRLFPNAQFAIWVDAKLELRVDPIQLLERFLWRGNFTWAISKHYKRFDIFEEAERNKAAGKYSNASIDEQVEVYRKDGMTPYSEAKLPIISDVPEGCVIIRELVPLSNLLACIWFNEVDRFTSRDQLSFGYCRDKIRRGVAGWNLNMFLDCERRNFVVQGYHKDVLQQKFGNVTLPVSPEKTSRESGRR